jgi:hypothetical protein
MKIDKNSIGLYFSLVSITYLIGLFILEKIRVNLNPEVLMILGITINGISAYLIGLT